MELKGKKGAFLGDSITEGAGASCKENNFVNVFGRITGAEALNFGKSGTRISKQPMEIKGPGWDEDFLERAKRIPEDVDAIVVFGGTNDFGHGFAPLGAMEDRTSYTFYGAMHMLLLYLLEHYPNADLLVLTPTHRLNEENPFGDGGDRKTVRTGILREYVQAEREVCEYYSINVLDLFAVSGMQPRIQIIKETYMPDGLHPNDKGHERIANLVANTLKLR